LLMNEGVSFGYGSDDNRFFISPVVVSAGGLSRWYGTVDEESGKNEAVGSKIGF